MSDQGEGTLGPAPEPEPDQTIGDAPPKSRGPGLLIGVGIVVVAVLAVIVGFLVK